MTDDSVYRVGCQCGEVLDPRALNEGDGKCVRCGVVVPLTFYDMCSAFTEGGPKAAYLKSLLVIGEILCPVGQESIEDAAVRQSQSTDPNIRAVARALLADGAPRAGVSDALRLIALHDFNARGGKRDEQ